MKKLVAVLAVAWLGAIIGAATLWQQLDALRDHKASLQLRVQALEALEPARAAFAVGVPEAGVPQLRPSTRRLPRRSWRHRPRRPTT
jgi:hypothetical protein